jgi:DNA-binding GntR family transcriptional regulator
MHFVSSSTNYRKSAALHSQARAVSLCAKPDEPTLVERAYEAILERILDGRLKEGDTLSEVVLAKTLAMSRTPVHDALRLLAIDGFATQERNCRARVAGFSADGVFEIFEMRKLLEGHAAELSAGRMDGRQIMPLRAMAASLHEGLKSRDWNKRWADFDAAFHHAIAEASGNSRLCADILRYRLLHRGINRFSTDPKSLLRALAEHEGILDAIEARNQAVARERMVAHIKTWQLHFTVLFKESSIGRRSVAGKMPPNP